MSMMAINALKDAVAIFNLNKPSQIASHLYNELIKNNAKPLNLNLLLGIEFMVCKYTKNAKVLEYSGTKYHLSISIPQITIKPFAPNATLTVN